MIPILLGDKKWKLLKSFKQVEVKPLGYLKHFVFNGTEVAIKSFGRGVLLMPIDNPWDVMLEALNEFEVGFKLERADQGEQVREDFK